MKKVYVIDRKSNKKIEEKIYGKDFLIFLYKNSFISKLFSFCICKFSFFSKIYGYFQRKKCSKKKILPFIKAFGIDENEFEEEISSFNSFNDFFIRKLKKSKRPIEKGAEVAILPADGRYLVFKNISAINDFYVKGQKFCLQSLLKDELLYKEFKDGSMVIGRLSPMDYHRFHFPFSCKSTKAKLINGYLYSVNPIALKTNINIFSENKRYLTVLNSDFFGKVLYIEVGATNVGSITQTYDENRFIEKGEEKGFFSFGGSTIILLFQKEKISFEKDLLENSKNKIETKDNFGSILGKSTKV